MYRVHAAWKHVKNRGTWMAESCKVGPGLCKISCMSGLHPNIDFRLTQSWRQRILGLTGRQIYRQTAGQIDIQTSSAGLVQWLCCLTRNVGSPSSRRHWSRCGWHLRLMWTPPSWTLWLMSQTEESCTSLTAQQAAAGRSMPHLCIGTLLWCLYQAACSAQWSW